MVPGDQGRRVLRSPAVEEPPRPPTDAKRRPLSRPRGLLLALALAATVFLVDQAIKTLVEGSMHLGESVVLIEDLLYLTYIKNSGGAFGILGGQEAVLLVGSAVAVAFVLWMLIAAPPTRLTVAGCGLVLGGAAGNLLDRLSSGEVTDYVHFTFWYIFNAADAAIVVGVGLLLLSALRSEKFGRQAG
jgi:signal peptidase II